MGLGWDDVTPFIPGYNSAKDLISAGGSAINGVISPPNLQYQDRAQMQDMLKQGVGQYTNIQAPQLQMGDDPFRRAQLAQMQQLQGISSGQQQGAGELATQRQYGNAMASQQAQARMARGGNAALAYRNAANQSAALGSSAAGAGQQAAMQDQMNAQGMMGQVGAAGRAGDFSTANANAGYQMGNNQLNSQNYMGYLQQLNNQNIAKYQSDAQLAGQNQQAKASIVGGGLSAAGSAIAMSDERAKTKVADARGDIDRMLDGLSSARGPVSFVYRDPVANGAGRVTGVMAQDLERSPAGQSMVQPTPAGKVVDTNRAAMAALAASARLHERLKQLESQQPVGLSGAVYPRAMQSVTPRRYEPPTPPMPTTVPAGQFAPDVQVLWPDGTAAPRLGLSPNRTPVPAHGRIALYPPGVTPVQ